MTARIHEVRQLLDANWQRIWRASVPLLPLSGLEALAQALREDSPALVQRLTTNPPPLWSIKEQDCCGACPWGYCLWRGEGLQTVMQVHGRFGDLCEAVNAAAGETYGVRWFMQWVDSTPRDEMRAALLPEVEAALEQRRAA